MALKVIGAGLGRTGTASLKGALEQLGFDPCYHMFEVIQNPDFIDRWMKVASGAPDWEAVFEGYRAAVDFPAASYWRELAEFYPDAKVILSTRSPESWFASTSATIFNPDFTNAGAETPFGEMVKATIFGYLGVDPTDEAAMIERFRRHEADVLAEIPADRLLVFEAKEGWEPLCRFLGVDQPDGAFPKVNSREETAAILRALAGGAPPTAAL